MANFVSGNLAGSMKKVNLIIPFFLLSFLCLLLAGLFSFTRKNPVLNDKNICFRLIREMADSVDRIKTLRCHIKAIEKVGSRYLSADSDLKLQNGTRKIYLKNPEKKLEILYLEGQHGNDALVKPHVFPYTSLYLDPGGSLMRKNQHYTIHELGFVFIARTMKSILVRDGEKALKNLSYIGTVNKGGEICHMIIYENKEFGYYDYVVGKNESVATIAAKKHLSDFMIRFKNDLSSYYGNIKEGKIIKLPNNYCRKATIFISEKSKMPVAINLYDEKELWEGYEHSNIIVNKPIDPAEFTRGYKEYHF